MNSRWPCVIIGGGAAGFSAAETITKVLCKAPVLLLEEEEEAGYFRALLPQFITRTIEEHRLFFSEERRPNGVTLETGVRVESLDPRSRTLGLSDGREVAYERLIVACGAKPIVPSPCDTRYRGVFAVRSLKDGRAIRDWLSKDRAVVVLGGGLVGVKTASHLAEAGYRVTVVEREERLLPQALSARAAERARRHLESMGVFVITGSSVEEMDVSGGAIKSVRVGGRWRACGSLLVAVGAVPNIAFLEGTGLVREGELVVNLYLQTPDSRIYAAGDGVTIRAEGREFRPWTWPQAVLQGKIAAANLFRESKISLLDTYRANTMNLSGLPLAILESPGAKAEVVSYECREKGLYREIFLDNGRIVGGALLGDMRGAGNLYRAMVSGVVLEDPFQWVRPHSSVVPGKVWSALENHNSKSIALGTPW